MFFYATTSAKRLWMPLEHLTMDDEARHHGPLRCRATTGLEVRHETLYGGNGYRNTIVLCQACIHHAVEAGVLPNFNDGIVLKALVRSGNRCECNSDSGCH